MERKIDGRRKGPVSPRNEDEVFVYPGLEDESDGSGPVSRDAYTALRQGILVTMYMQWALKTVESVQAYQNHKVSQRREGKLLVQCGIPHRAHKLIVNYKGATQVFSGVSH